MQYTEVLHFSAEGCQIKLGFIQVNTKSAWKLSNYYSPLTLALSWLLLIVLFEVAAGWSVNPFTNQLEYFSVWSTMKLRCMSKAFFLFSSNISCCLYSTIYNSDNPLHHYITSLYAQTVNMWKMGHTAQDKTIRYPLEYKITHVPFELSPRSVWSPWPWMKLSSLAVVSPPSPHVLTWVVVPDDA